MGEQIKINGDGKRSSTRCKCRPYKFPVPPKILKMALLEKADVLVRPGMDLSSYQDENCYQPWESSGGTSNPETIEGINFIKNGYFGYESFTQNSRKLGFGWLGDTCTVFDKLAHKNDARKLNTRIPNSSNITSFGQFNQKDKSGLFLSNKALHWAPPTKESLLDHEHNNWSIEDEQHIKVPTDRAILAQRGFFMHKRIGKGNFSKVVVASNVRGSQVIAVKIINLLTAPEDFREKFMPRELAIWPTLAHPNIVQMYASFRKCDKIYMMLEYACQGDALSYVQKHGKAPEPQARRWFTQLVRAIEYLHERRGIAHRDLKLENVLLDCNLNIKIADFGFCRQVVTPLTDLTGTAHVPNTSNWSSPNSRDINNEDVMNFLSQTYCGSKSYACPEILKSQSYDPKGADIWSMGVILCVWVTSYMPFDENIRSTETLIRRQMTWTIENLRPVLAVSTECEDMITKLLTFEADSRPSIRQIAQHKWIHKPHHLSTHTPLGIFRKNIMDMSPSSPKHHGINANDVDKKDDIRGPLNTPFSNLDNKEEKEKIPSLLGKCFGDFDIVKISNFGRGRQQTLPTISQPLKKLYLKR